MNSVRERLLLNTYVWLYFGVPEATVIRMPANPVVRGDDPVLLFGMEEDRILRRSNTVVERALVIKLIALARIKQAWDVADRLMVSAHATLMDTKRHASLGGNAIAINEVDCEWEADETDDAVVSIPARYEIYYRTLLHDLTQTG